jgi:hypothetical protein
MPAEVAGAAFQRFVDALNLPRDAVVLSAAVAADVRIDRHAPGARGTAPIAEAFTGIAEVARWLARTPPVITFALVGTPWPDAGAAGETWGVEYAIHAGEFHNGGIWIARLAADEKISYLAHHPFPLRDDPPGR